MIATVAVDDAETGQERPSPYEATRERSFEPTEIDPLASLIARLNEEIERRDESLDEPFVLTLSRPSSVPLALCGTRTRASCDEGHAGRCRTICVSRSREWRAELDAAASGPDGRSSYDLVYALRWTSDWYRDG